MLTRDGCAARVERFRALLDEAQLDAALISDPRELHYFLGQPLPPAGDFPAAALIETAGAIVLCCHAGAEPFIADQVETYTPHVGYTRNLDNGRALADLMDRTLAGRSVARVGYQAEHLSHHLAACLDETLKAREWEAVDDPIYELQRPKDPDELECMKTSIASVQAAYAAIEERLAPGVSELEILAAGQSAAMVAAGAPVWHSGDYQSGTMGGLARPEPLQAGDLYVVDAWTVYDGYWADLCRTFAVTEPTELQQSVYDHLVAILREVPEQLRPGAKGTEIWAWMDARIREHPHLAQTGLIHHAGHGVGIRPHTAPDLNRDREGVLQEGDTVSVEPGGYSDELRAGIRVENSFRITADGCEVLSDYPLSLRRNG